MTLEQKGPRFLKPDSDKNDSWDDIVHIAEIDTEISWGEIDGLISDPDFRARFCEEAFHFIGNEKVSGCAQDLSASIFQVMTKREYDDFLKVHQDLVKKLVYQTYAGSNKYAQYRAAFVIAQHGDPTEGIWKIIEEAKEDPATKNIALILLASKRD